MKRRAKHPKLSCELYGKRFNYLTYGSNEIAGETIEQTEKLYGKLLNEGLKIHDPNSTILCKKKIVANMEFVKSPHFG